MIQGDASQWPSQESKQVLWFWDCWGSLRTKVWSMGYEAGAHTLWGRGKVWEVGKAKGSWVTGDMRHFLVTPLAALTLLVQNIITCSLVQLPLVLFTRAHTLTRSSSQICVLNNPLVPIKLAASGICYSNGRVMSSMLILFKSASSTNVTWFEYIESYFWGWGHSLIMIKDLSSVS